MNENKSIIQDGSFINIQSFMVKDLHLKGNELMLYAIIWGFSQDGTSAFKGSLQYLMEWTNSTKQGVLKALKSLQDKGYIQKSDVNANGRRFCDYSVTKFNSGKQSLPKVNSVDNKVNLVNDLGKQSLPHNIVDNIENNIENETSTFNQHRLAVIRYKIENNLAIAISNYNAYSGVKNVFQMPELKEDEWDQIIHNISLISFLQGLPIGEKTYNGYTLVTNSESEEVVLEGNIFMLGNDQEYHRIGDKVLENGVNVMLYDDDREYGNISSAGRLNLDFKRRYVTDTSQTQTYYYYQMRNFKASYNSVVMQDKVTTFDDIYKYISGVSENYQRAFYTALGRERQGSSTVDMISILIKRQKNKQQLETGG